MFEFSIFILSLMGYIVFFCWKLSLSIEEAPILAVSSIVLILYILALVGLLQPAAYVVLFGGLILLIITVVFQRKELKEFACSVATPGFVVYLVGLPVLFYFSYNVIFFHWDEFSHWGLVVKAMTLRNALPDVGSRLPYASYLPGTALFQYYACNLFGFKEGIAIFAHVLMVWSGAVAFTKRFQWKHVPLVALMLGLAYVGYIHFSNSMWSIYVDGLLGLLAGCVFVLYYQTQDRTTSDILKTYPLLALITLVKESGVFLCILLCILMAADQLFLAKQKIGVGDSNDSFIKRHKYKLLIAIALIIPIVVNVSWSLHLKDEGIRSSQAIVANALFDQIGGTVNSGLLPTFLTALVNTDVGLTKQELSQFSTSVILLSMNVVVSVVFIVLVKDKSIKKRAMILFAALFLVVVIYCFGLVATYTFRFNQYEGARLASFGRYMGTIFLPMFLIVSYFIINYMKERGVRTIEKVISAVMICMVIGSLYHVTPDWYTNIRIRKVMDKNRTQISRAAGTLNRVAKTTDKIYIVWQNTSGRNYLITKYELYPHAVNTHWSIGRPYGSNDIWTKELTAEQWSELLHEYQYVYVGSADAQFTEQFGSLFPLGEVKSDCIYSVVVHSDQEIELMPYQPSSK